MKTKDILLLFLVILLSASLPFISKLSSQYTVFSNLPAAVNKHVVYQLITLFLTVGLLFLFNVYKRKNFNTYFKKGNISAPITAEPFVGIKPNKSETWFHFGRNFAVIITVVTGIVIYFQTLKEYDKSYYSLLKAVPIAIIFAITNSFVEECITRLGIIVTLKNIIPGKYIKIASGLLFGIIHYWGNPGGVVGIFVAGFLGWFLAKSILETKGIFWAWFIHFLQDVVIFTALIAIS